MADGLFGGNFDWLDLSGAKDTAGAMGDIGGLMPTSAAGYGQMMTPQTSGMFGDISKGFETGMDWLKKYQEPIKAGAGLFGTAMDYQRIKGEQDYAKGLLDLQRRQIGLTEAERQRQIEKELYAGEQFQGEYGTSGLFGVRKERETPSNYYAV